MPSSDKVVEAAWQRLSPYAAKARRAAFRRRLLLSAAAVGATVDLDVAPDVTLGRGVRWVVEPGTHSTLHLGPGCIVNDDVVFDLKGGTLDATGWDNFRRQVVVNVSGHLTLGHAVVLGMGTNIHCAGTMRIGSRNSIAEFTTIVDSTHLFTQPGMPPYEVDVGQITIGDDCFVGAKCTFTKKASLGDYCVVGAGSTVVGPIPERTFASGVPAKALRRVPLPWDPA